MPANTDHPSFPQPTEQDMPIWRYMDLGKFVSMLSSGALYFARADLLGDPHECAAPTAIVEHRDSLLKQLRDNGEEVLGLYGSSGIHAKSECFVNCWCLQKGESNALWQIYGTEHGGLAIRSSYARLRDSLSCLDDLGVVKYIDYASERFEDNNMLNYVMHKRKAFDYEREVRAVRWLRVPGDDAKEEVRKAWDATWAVVHENSVLGLHVPVSMPDLIEEVVVSPYSPRWFVDAITSLVATYKLSVPVNRSSMATSPRYDFYPLTKKARDAIEHIRQTGKPVTSSATLRTKPSR